MWPIMTLPALLNKRLMKASNWGGFHDPDHTTSTDYACLIRHRGRELGCDVGHGLFAAWWRSFHPFLHCFFGFNNDCAGGCCDAESAVQGAETVGGHTLSLWESTKREPDWAKPNKW
jgi:hypothetical protein